MPAPGQQHTAWTNPFEEMRPRVSEWTAKEIATISSKLDKQLGPEYISSRAGPGGSRVHYMTAEKCIGLANEVFGFNGWSSSIQNIQVDFADENPQTQRVNIGLSVIVRVTLRDGTFHEDIGYGSVENAKGKATAFEKAKKEGTTDGLKRALRSFGNVLGNCIYDKEYVKQVTKVKAQPVKKFDEIHLHRHADFVQKDVVKVEKGLVKVEPASNNTKTAVALPSESFEDYLGELDEADFCVPGEGHPDEVTLPNLGPVQGPSDKTTVHQQQQQQQQPMSRQPTRTASTVSNGQASNVRNASNSASTTNEALHNNFAPANGGRDTPKNAFQPPQRPEPQQMGNAAEPVSFFSARSVSLCAEEGTPGPPVGPRRQLFNPKAESPSIRKTPGIDHSSSKPVTRSKQHALPSNSQSSVNVGADAGGFTPHRQTANGTRANIVNPSLDYARRIGVPGVPPSPLANRGAYKPPSMKRPLPADGGAAASTRPPLAEVATNITTPGQVGAPAAGSAEAKRQKMA